MVSSREFRVTLMALFGLVLCADFLPSTSLFARDPSLLDKMLGLWVATNNDFFRVSKRFDQFFEQSSRTKEARLTETDQYGASVTLSGPDDFRCWYKISLHDSEMQLSKVGESSAECPTGVFKKFLPDCDPAFGCNESVNRITDCDRLAASQFDDTRPIGVPGVDPDKIDASRAIPACQSALAERHDDARIMFQLGRALARVGDESSLGEAARVYRKAADQGFAPAQFNLGYCYEAGHGVPQSYEQAARLYREAADQGFAPAQSNLGLFYEAGHGVTQDYAQAMKWFQKAAEQDVAEAQYNIGDLYENGHGVWQDYAEALTWYRKAANHGEPHAQSAIGTFYENGRGGITVDYAQAMIWYRKAADQGYAPAQTHLGRLYQIGFAGVRHDYAQAMTLYRKAADQGYAEAQFWVGFLLEAGYGVTQDAQQAIIWYRKAADQGNQYAIEALRRLAP